MTRSELLKIINKAIFEDNIEIVVKTLNEIFANNEYKNYLDLVSMAISSFHLYGFLAYFNNDEIAKVVSSDYIRISSYKGETIDYYNNGQLSLLNEFLENKKVFLSAPTSFGKTSIVNEFVIDHKRELNNIVYIVPTNSLMEELYQKFIIYNKTLNLNYNLSTQCILTKERNIFFLTPERFLLLIENIDINKFDLIVMDEAYKIVDSRNKKISDFINQRSVRFRKVSEVLGAANTKVIFLSPFTYKKTPSMIKFFKKYNIKDINRTLEYVNREIVDLSSSYAIKNYFSNNNIIGYTKSLPMSKKVAVLLKLLENEKNIVYISNYHKGYEIVKDVKILKVNSNSEYFLRYKSFLKYLNKNFTIDGINKWTIIEALEKGCALYISPMPRFIKKEIIKLYEQDVLNTLIVTTSFTEGVNTNAKNLIFTSLVNGPNSNKLANIDILNVAGRAGRFSKSPYGKVVCIDSDVYNSIKQLQDSSLILLDHYNYLSQSSRIDFEIDMIDNEYLSEEDKLKKIFINEEMRRLNLTTKDLNISLNVSNLWKIILYKHFTTLNDNELNNVIKNIEFLISEDSKHRGESVEFVLKTIKQVLEKQNINPFPMQKYEIPVFDNKDKCIWSILYKIYCKGTSKKIIEANIHYIKSEYKKILDEIPQSFQNNKDIIYRAFVEKNKLWILSKYYDNNLNLKYNTFYSETFKFISNVIQYKIPFYMGYFVSIFNLFAKKSKKIKNYQQVDVRKITMVYEDGNANEEYNEMVDFGMSNDLILKLMQNNISKKELLSNNYNRSNYDEYERIMIDDYIQFCK